MDYTLYYSDINDLVPPSVWKVDAYRDDEFGYITVEVTDLSDVVRVGVSYTLGGGAWVTTDLERSLTNPNLWTGKIPDSETVEWFVQAVDAAGNVAVNDNKGAYFGRPPEPFWNWLPLILR